MSVRQRSARRIETSLGIELENLNDGVSEATIRAAD